MSLLKKCVTLAKVGDTWKNRSELVKLVTLMKWVKLGKNESHM